MQQNKHFYSGNKLSPSMEEYLKCIYKLSKKNQIVRSIDIAIYLNVTRPSVHNAVATLLKKEMIIKTLNGSIQLTADGQKQGEVIWDKFQFIRKFLINYCSVSELTASADACKIEHIVSNETCYAIKRYLELCKDVCIKEI